MTQGSSTEIGGVGQDHDFVDAAERLAAPVVRLVDAARRRSTGTGNMGPGTLGRRSCGAAPVPPAVAQSFAPADAVAANDNVGIATDDIFAQADEDSPMIVVARRRWSRLWHGYATVGLCSLASAILGVWMVAFLG